MNRRETPELNAKARKMYADGMSFVDIALALKINRDTARRWVDDEYRERKAARQIVNQQRRRKLIKEGAYVSKREPEPPPQPVRPPDTRDIGAILLGDPPPWRSALAMRNAGGKQ